MTTAQDPAWCWSWPSRCFSPLLRQKTKSFLLGGGRRRSDWYAHLFRAHMHTHAYTHSISFAYTLRMEVPILLKICMTMVCGKKE